MDDILTIDDYKKVLKFSADIQKSETDFVGNLLRQIYEKFDYDVLSFFEVDDNGCFGNPRNINFGDRAISLYTEYYYKSDPFYFKNLQGDFCGRDSIYLEELHNEADFKNSEYFVDFFNKYNFGNEIGMYLKNDEKHIGAMGVMRFKGGKEFSVHDLALLNTITNVISHQYSLYLEQNRRLAKQDWLEKAFLHNPVGVVIADNNFEVVDYNESACKYCGEVEGKSKNGLVQQVLLDYLNDNSASDGSFCKKLAKQDYSFEIMESKANGCNGLQTNNYVLFITPGCAKKRESAVEKYSLTKREIQVIELIGRGLTNKQIAEELFISPQTVRTHVENIMTKTNANNRTNILFKVGKIR